jgi:hypothetical protein
MTIDVSTPVYEGPFDLLLQLILQEQVDIYEVSPVDRRRRATSPSSSGCRRSTSTWPPSSC